MFDSLNPRSSDSRDREAPGPRGAESLEPRDVFTRDLHLPRGPEHERVHVREHGQDHHLRGSEIRVLATIDAFRIMAADDLRDDQGRTGDVRHGDLERLRSAGLIRAVAPLDRGDRTVVVTLTERAREVLEYQKFLHERNRGRSDSDGQPDRSREEVTQWAIEHDLLVVNGSTARVEGSSAEGASAPFDPHTAEELFLR
jgi:DNA-binding MarR family transcriptional regulator